MSRTTKFTLYEADLALYPSDESDEVTGEAVFLGCCWERTDCSRTYTVQQRPFLGSRFQQNYNADEGHTIELANPLQVGPLGEIKSLDRFGRYLLVLVWFDEEQKVWLKRTYYGVTDATEQVGGEVVIGNKMTLRAERLSALSGRQSRPDLLPEQVPGLVVYVLGAQRLALYAYEEGGFVALPTLDTSKGEIVTGAGTLSFMVEGQLAMLASGTLQPSGTGLYVHELVALGGSFYDTPQGRLEFLSDGIRVATLGKDGTLAVPDLLEADAAPGAEGDMELRVESPDLWVASLGRGLSTVVFFSEFL